MKLGNLEVYLVESDDPNIGTIYTLIPAHADYGEKTLGEMTMQEFVDRADSTDAKTRIDPSRGDLLGILSELVGKGRNAD